MGVQSVRPEVDVAILDHFTLVVDPAVPQHLKGVCNCCHLLVSGYVVELYDEGKQRLLCVPVRQRPKEITFIGTVRGPCSAMLVQLWASEFIQQDS